MNDAERKRLRCRPGDLARVVTSRNPALIGTIVAIQRMRFDGRWDVLLEKPTFGFTRRERRPVVTCEFSFWDDSLEPLPEQMRKVSRRPACLHQVRPGHAEMTAQEAH